MPPGLGDGSARIPGTSGASAASGAGGAHNGPRGALMVCGTASDVGKSRIVTGLCRALARRGHTVAPFKGQNMSLNSTVTPSGHEIARSQALQAFAARTEVEVLMGPVLLKPAGEVSSQLVVMGRPAGEVSFGTGWDPGDLLTGVVLPALGQLRRRFDFVLVEGAGGAAEVNLLERDIANLPLARAASLPAVLVGDIERGGVFASLFGTVALLPDDLRAQLRGFVINKFRGDPHLLRPGIDELARRLSMPCLGVLPHLGVLAVDEEDSLALAPRPATGATAGATGEQAAAYIAGDVAADESVDVAVIGLPHISNFTDFAPLALESTVRVRHVYHPGSLGDPDLVVLPGSKATVADLGWLRSGGFLPAIDAARRRGASLLGVCAGYQMLGTDIYDTVESGVGHVPGLGALAVTTAFRPLKTTRWRQGRTASGEPVTVTGFEIHHGQPVAGPGDEPWFLLGDGLALEPEGVADPGPGLWATSLHGLFENDELRARFLSLVAERRGKRFRPSGVPFGAAREQMVDLLADAVEAHLDLSTLVAIAGEAAPVPAAARRQTPSARRQTAATGADIARPICDA
ncbi:MAG: cobyric acid synthase [Acidimicrobiales bacterium]